MNRLLCVLAIVVALEPVGLNAALAGENCVSDYACTTGEFRTHDNLSNPGDWNSLSTWQECLNDQDGWWCDATAIPGSSDDVTIRSGDVVQVKGIHACNELTLASNGGAGDPGEVQLVSGGGELTIYGAITVLISGTPGLITFVDGASTSTPGELVFDCHATVEDIQTAATNGGGKITVTSSHTLTVNGNLDVVDGDLATAGSVILDGDATVSGGNFTSDGTFQNDGTFTLSGANVTAQFTKPQGQSGAIAAGSSGTWTVSNSSARWLISTPCTVSVTGGNIVLEAGKIDVDAHFNFNGEMSWEGAASTIDVAANKVFEAFSQDFAE